MSAGIGADGVAPIVRMETIDPPRAKTVAEAQPTGKKDSPDAQLLQSLTASLQTVVESVEQLSEQRRQSLEELQQVAVELSVAAARWLLGVAIEADMFAVDDLVRRAVERLDSDTGVTVRLHPDDLRLLQALQSESDDDTELPAEVKSDATLSRGSCRVEAGRQTLLSDMDSRLEDIRRMWLESLDASQVERRRNGANASGLRRFPERRETA